MTRPIIYPETRRDPVIAEVGGVCFDDPYQWLEPNSPEVLTWQREQDEVAAAYIERWPHLGTLRKLVETYTADVRLTPPVRAGSWWFERVIPPGRDHAVLRISTAPCGPGQVLVDANEIAGDRAVSLDWFSPSPDGRLVAVGLSEGGSERSRLHLFHVPSGEMLPDQIPHLFDFGEVAWLPDSSGFYYMPLDPRPDRYEQVLLLHRIGSPPSTQPEQVTLPAFGFPVVTTDGRYMAVYGLLAAKPTIIRELPDGDWQPFLPDSSSSFSNGVFVGDAYLTVTTEGAPKGRLVSIPIRTATDRTTWKELLAESDAVQRSVHVIGDRLLVEELVDAAAHLRILTLSGEECAVVTLPGPGTVRSSGGSGPGSAHMAGPGDDHEFLFVFDSITQSSTVYRYHVQLDELQQLTQPECQVLETEVRFERCVSDDGTPVTYRVVHRKDVDPSGALPTLIHGYGGFNGAFVPTFTSDAAAFVQAGGAYVHANLRGGAEHGQDFRRTGRLEHKQNTFNDLYAIAQHLIDAGRTAPHLLAVMGGSNGGLLAGAAAVLRPDLFAVSVPRVPILDLLRAAHDPYGLIGVREDYGDPLDPDGARHLLSFSPYQNVRENTAYPAVLFDCGSADPRCPAWHGRKTAAAMQHATSSSRPVLLRVWDDVGHGLTTGLSTKIEQTTSWLAFTMMNLGMHPEPGQPNPRRTPRTVGNE